jgi:hypothetical protein
MSVYSEMTITQLLEERNKLDAQIYGLCGSSGSTPSGKAEKPKAEKVKRKSGPTAWSDWTKKVLAENKEAVKAFTEAAEKKLGAHLQWIKANMGKESPEWKAYQAEWQATHPKEAKEVSDEGSEVSAPSKSGRRGPKKLDEMTVEERAKHDATIAERRAKKEAEKAAGEAAGKAESAAAPVSSAPASSASSVVSTEKKKSSYVKVADMTPEQKAKYEANKEKAKAAKAAKSAPKPAAEAEAKPVAAAPKAATPKAEAKPKATPKPAAEPKAATPKPVAEPVAEEAEESESEAEMEIIPYELEGKSYFRLGTKNADGTVAWESDFWTNKNGKRGDYIGTLEEDGSFDTDAVEPVFE